MNYRIRHLGDDPDFDTRVMEISVSGKKLITPLKTIDRRGTIGEMNEVAVRFGPEDVLKAVTNPSNKLNKLVSSTDGKAINVIIPEYTGFGFGSEHDELLSKMESRIHASTDIVVVPRWRGVFDMKNGGMLFDNLVDHTKKFIEESNKLNGKLLMGNIPVNIPESVVDKMIRFYMNQGVYSYVLDYGTCLPHNYEHIVRNIQKKLIDSGNFENNILYSMNARRTMKSGNIYPADDFMNFCYGIDVIGNLHLGGGSASPDKDYSEMKAKQFVPSDFTYSEVTGISQKQKDNLKVFNCRLQNDEIKGISSSILENTPISEILRNKAGARRYVGHTKQSTLDFFDELDLGFTV